MMGDVRLTLSALLDKLAQFSEFCAELLLNLGSKFFGFSETISFMIHRCVGISNPMASLMRRRNFQVFTVFGHRAPGYFNTFLLQLGSNLLIG